MLIEMASHRGASGIKYAQCYALRARPTPALNPRSYMTFRIVA